MSNKPPRRPSARISKRGLAIIAAGATVAAIIAMIFIVPAVLRLKWPD
jgi:hypothetical protein